MWYLIVNNMSERFFIKQKNSLQLQYYFIKENTTNVEIKATQELKENHYKVVSKAFDYECEKLNKLLNNKMSY